MKKCAYCGRENDDDAIYCRECGTNEFKHSGSTQNPTEPPPILQSTANRFVRYAATFSILTPLVVILVYVFLFVFLQSHGGTKFKAIIAIGFLQMLLIVSGLVFGIIALAAVKRHEHRGVIRQGAGWHLHQQPVSCIAYNHACFIAVCFGT
jgi:hypothetical protein